MKHKFTIARSLIAAVAFTICAVLNVPLTVCLGVLALCGLINPFTLFAVGVAAYPGLGAQDTTDITTLSPDAQQVIYSLDLIQSSKQVNPFAKDNMSGPMGSGKPFIDMIDTTKVQGQEIVIITDTAAGGPGVYGSDNPVGLEEGERTGDFKLRIGLWDTTPIAITQQAMSQTIPGAKWPARIREKLRDVLGTKQGDDQMMSLLSGAADFNTIYPVGKTLDTITSGDVFSSDLVIALKGRANDIGALPANTRPVPARGSVKLPPVNKHIAFLTEACARVIKGTSYYTDGIINAGIRGPENQFFTGEYADVDGTIIYPWVNIEHDAYAPIGSPLQPEALLGTAFPAKGAAAANTVPWADGGGSTAAAAAAPYRAWFQNFSLYLWKYCNSLTSTLGSGTRYFAIKNATDGKISLFSYTTNRSQVGITTSNRLAGTGAQTVSGSALVRLGSTVVASSSQTLVDGTTGYSLEYNTTVGNVTWSTSSTPPALGNSVPGSQGYTTVADGNGFTGLSEGAIAVNSHIYECNANFQPIGRGLLLGEMAGVSGYGTIRKLDNSGTQTAAMLEEYINPYGKGIGILLRICYGTKAFLRTDAKAPNYVAYYMARTVQGFPNIGA